ncbi:MAG: ribonuclease P protein component [Alistipes sp.]|nr:ribonuclease P protein component [Alistipes sp.]
MAILVSAPKKSFKRAWRRNLIKRRIKESYRRRKGDIVEKAVAAGLHIDIAFVCSAGAPPAAKATSNSAKSIAKSAKSAAVGESAGAPLKVRETSVIKSTKKSGGRAAALPAEAPDFESIDNAVSKILARIAAHS